MTDEVLPLTRSQVDLEAGTLWLPPGGRKNGDGRLVYLTPELKAGLTPQPAKVRALEHELGRVIPHVFPALRAESGEPPEEHRVDMAAGRVKEQAHRQVEA